MDALRTLFLESPLQLAILSVVLLLAAYAVWLRAESDRWKLLTFPVALSVIVLLFVVQSLVTTQREELDEALARLIAAVSRHDVAAIGPMVAADYGDGDMDRAALMAFVADALKNTDVYDARIGEMRVTIAGEQAETEFGVTATVRVRGFVGRVPSRWLLTWARGPSGWKIVTIQPLEVVARPVKGLRELRQW